MSRQKPAAFLSYVHTDDRNNHLSMFCKLLSEEVRMVIGEEFPIFQDRKDILWGQKWAERLEESLDTVTFLIPIITPSFFNSKYCRAELQHFLKREKYLGRNDLILPVYYVDCPLLNDEARRRSDELAQTIADRQYADWRDLRFESFDSPKVHRALHQLAMQIRDSFDRLQAARPSIYSARSQSDVQVDFVGSPIPDNAIDKKKLISIRIRRLQKLKEEQAIKGVSTPPEILIEIEDLVSCSLTS
jgi:hypothetical protein